MSISNDSDLVTLNVGTGDASAEVFVIDARFNLAGRGIGQSLTFRLDPGVYKVKVVSGSQHREEPVVLRPGAGPVSKEFPPLAFASPAPLADTAQTHEFHIAAASEHSRNVHFELGRGSWLFVCARGWTEKRRTDHTTGDRTHPARGLKLLDERGDTIADFETGSEKDLGWEPWAACNVGVEPGAYRLQLEVPSLGRTLEQTVVASPGWQTQVFLLQRDYAQEAGRRAAPDVRADLSGASILMCGQRHGGDGEPPGFDPGHHDLRQAELARHALLHERKILSDEVRSILNGKFENPMLGIFGAHLLLLEKEPDMGLLGCVVENLRKLVGREHPDVEALALRVEGGSDYAFKTPPMLQRSWSLICKETAERPELVPEKSLLSEVAESWWCSTFWLTWLTPIDDEGFESAEDAGELTDLEEAILVRLKAARRTHRRDARRRSSSLLDFVGLERSADAPDDAAADEDLALDVERISADEEEVKKLTHQLGVPRSVLEKSLAQLPGKISSRKR